MNQPHSHSKDPLHGVTLEAIVTALVERFGWDELGRIIDIRCFNFDPSVSSSLKFLRKTPWARKKVEELYIDVRLEAEQKEMTKPASLPGEVLVVGKETGENDDGRSHDATEP